LVDANYPELLELTLGDEPVRYRVEKVSGPIDDGIDTAANAAAKPSARAAG